MAVLRKEEHGAGKDREVSRPNRLYSGVQLASDCFPHREYLVGSSDFVLQLNLGSGFKTVKPEIGNCIEVLGHAALREANV